MGGAILIAARCPRKMCRGQHWATDQKNLPPRARSKREMHIEDPE